MDGTIVRNSAEKRSLEVSFYEEGVMAKKCRRFDEDDGYDLIDTMKGRDEQLEPNLNSGDGNSKHKLNTQTNKTT